MRKSQAKQYKSHHSNEECDNKHASDLLQRQEEDTFTEQNGSHGIREERRRQRHTRNEQKRESVGEFVEETRKQQKQKKNGERVALELTQAPTQSLV